MNPVRHHSFVRMFALLVILLSSVVGVLAPSQVAAQTSTCVSSRISVSADDAEQRINTGTTNGDVDLDGDTSSHYLQMYRAYGGSTTDLNWWGLRFLSVNVPQGATITSASVTFRASATNATAAGMTLSGELAANPVTFAASSNNISSRTRTTASVAWSVPAWTSGTDYASPSLTAIVQEIVNQSGWAANNAMVIVGQATVSQNRSAISRDSTNGSTLAPQLSVCYTTGPVGPMIFTSGTLSAFSTQPGVPSAAQTYTVAGSNLTADIDISAPAGFQISKDGSSYGTALALAQSSGTVATTTIYVRLYSATEGTPSGNIVHTSASATTVNVAVAGTVSNCMTVSLEAVDDGYLSGYNTTYNYGASDPIKTTLSTSTPRGSLYKWDVSGIPASATVSSASLKLNVTTSAAATFSLYNMRRAWVEGTGSGSATGDGATWQTYDGTNAWGTNGAANTTSDRYDTNLWGAGSTTFNSTGSKTVSLNSDGVAVVQGWISGATSNYGLTMQNYASSSTSYDLQVNSNNNATAANRPTLIIAYCAATGPSITTSGTLAAFSSTVNVPSAEQSYSVSGSNLTEALVVSAPSGFQISTVSGSGFGSSVSLSPVGNTVAPTTIYVRLLMPAAGTSSGNISHTSTGATTRTVAVSGTATSAPPSVSLQAPADDATGVALAPTLVASVSDPEADPMTVSFYGRAAGGTVTAADFTMIVIPDSQNEATSNATMMGNQFQWIADQYTAGSSASIAKNIVFATSVGDIVNTASSTTEYGNADSAYDRLDAAGVPYSVSPGNHDIGGLFNTYFGPSRFTGKSYYQGPMTSGANESNYSFISAGGMDFIIINLTYNPSSTVLNWADALLKANTGRRGIVVEHDILNTDNSWYNQAAYTALKDNPNLFLMLCGHMHSASDGSAYRAELGDDSHTIHILMTDYQDVSSGNGYLRLLRFSPADDKIYAKIYSPTAAGYLTSAANYEEFAMAYTMPDGTSSPFELIGTLSSVASGASPSIAWPSRAATTEYEWYATASDGGSTTTSPTWSFTTGSGAPVTYALSVVKAGTGGGTVTSTPEGIHCGADCSEVYNSGQSVSLAVVADANSTFTGWGGACTGSGACTVTMDAAKSVTANFAVTTFTLHYAAGTGGSLSGEASQTVNYGASGSAVTAVPATGYHFVNWSDGSAANPRTDLNVVANVDVTANFALNSFTLHYAAGTGGSLSGEASQTVNYGASGTAVMALPNDGYYFVKWSDDSIANPRIDASVTANVDVTAGFALIPATAALSLPNVTGNQGDTIVVPVNAAGLQGLLAGDLTIGFDPAVVQILGVAQGALTAAWAAPTWNVPEPGSLYISFANPIAVTGDGSIVAISIKLIGAPGSTSSLTFAAVQLFNDAHAQIPVAKTNGSAAIAPDFSIGGSVHYWSGDVAVPAALLTLNGAGSHTAQSNAAGVYLIEHVAAGNYLLTPSYNGTPTSSAINAYDAALILQHNVKLITLSGAALTAADVDGQLGINALDAAYILQYSVQLIPLPFPNIGKVWDFAPATRSFTALAADQSGQDFTLTLFGDVDGSWTPAGGTSASAPGVDGSSVIFTAGAPEADGTRVIHVQIVPAAGKSGVSLEMDLGFDGAAYQALDPIVRDGWMVAANNRSAGRLLVAAAGAQGAAAQTTVLTLRFKPLGAQIDPTITVDSVRVDNVAGISSVALYRVLLPLTQR